MTKSAEADYGYTIERNSDHYSVSYKRGVFGVPYFLLFLLFSIGVSFFIILGIHVVLQRTAGFSMELSTALVHWLLLSLGLSVGAVVLINTRRKHRAVLIYQDRVVVDGMSFDQQHIRELYVKDPGLKRVTLQFDNRTSAGSMLGASGVFGVAGVAAAGVGVIAQTAGNLGTALGGAIVGIENSQKKKSGWSIFFDYGQRPVRVAKGLDEKRAKAMAQDLHRLIFVEF